MFGYTIREYDLSDRIESAIEIFGTDENISHLRLAADMTLLASHIGEEPDYFTFDAFNAILACAIDYDTESLVK